MRVSQKLASLIIAFGFVAGAAYGHQLGPTGLLGTVSKTTIKVTKVAKGSPADGKIKVGDQIIGAGASNFKKDVRRELADAIDEAEAKKAGGKLTLILKGGKKVELQLKVLGSYSDTAPYNCPKTDAIITRVADHMVKSGAYANGGLCVGWLGLMATGEEKYIDVVRKALPKQKLANPDMNALMAVIRGEKDMGYVGWYWGYRCITLSEYHLLTGDKSVLPAIKAYAVALAMGQDAGGLWGHRMATKARNGRLPGYAQMNQPSLTCFMALLLARKCGIEHPALTKAITKTHAFFASFIGKGALNYGVHGPNTRLYNNNGTSGSAALTMSFKGNTKGASFFSRLASTSYGGLETGHAGHFFNVLWTPLGANVAGPEVTIQFFKKSRWLHTLYRAWDGSFTFDGGSYKAGNSSGSHLLVYCLPRRKLYITGKNADKSIWLKGREATDAIELCNIDYKSKSVDDLIALFGHPIPQVTRRAVWTLREKKGDFIPRLVKMMKEGTKIEKQSAIGFFGYGCPNETALPRLDDLGAILRDPEENPEVRASAAGALCWLGEPAWKYYSDMLKLIADDEPGDIFRDVDQSVGGSINTLCKNSFKAGLVTDKDLFYKAALKLMDHKRQHGRGPGLGMIADMPLEDFHRVADKIVHVVRDQDRTYHSYHNPGGPVGKAITVLANLNIKEGIQHTLDVLDTESGKWGFKVRMVMSILPKYGANARDALEELKADTRLKTIELGKFRGPWQAMVKAIEEDKAPRKLISFEEAKQAGMRSEKQQ